MQGPNWVAARLLTPSPPQHAQVIVEKAEKSDIPDIDKKKCAVAVLAERMGADARMQLGLASRSGA